MSATTDKAKIESLLQPVARGYADHDADPIVAAGRWTIEHKHPLIPID